MLSYKKETHTPGMPEEGGRRGAPYQKGIWFLKKDHKKNQRAFAHSVMQPYEFIT
jgi:hypothetical protein